jgi:hypothetical protein
MNPNTGQGPYDTAIQDVESQIADLRRTLETLLTLKERREGASGASSSPRTGGGSELISHDTFFGMTISEAAQKYLSMTKATKSTADIAVALEQGGLKHSSKDFAANVRSIIGQKTDEFVRVPNGDWGLADWYPGLGRGRKVKPEKPAKSKGKSKQKGLRPKAVKPKLEDQIIEAMKADPNKDWTSVEIANAIGAQRTSVQSTMSRMAKDATKIVKAEKGYRLFRPMISAA